MMKINLKIIISTILISVLAVFLFPLILMILNHNQVLANEAELLKKPQIPGRIEGTGTYFEIKDSEYLNITLESSEKIKIVLESIPRMISLNIEASSTATSTNLTLSGLKPNKTYFKYQDSYKNGTEILADENGKYSWQQDLTQSHHIWIQEIQGTIYIDKDTILTSDINESLEITTNNITLDCQNHNITGGQTGYGIYLNSKKNITIKNCYISNFSTGIVLLNSSDILIQENNISSNAAAIQVTGYPSSNIKIQTNILSNNNWMGALLYGNQINNSQIINNEISNNGFGGLHLSGFSNIIENNNILNNGVIGLRLYDFDNKVIRNNLNLNREYGILLEYAWRNTISQNNINFNQKYGIRSWCSGQNIIFLNNFINNKKNYNWGTWEGCGISSPNILNSPEKLNYRYNNQTFINYLGNYWSDYLGFDINGDGIGEISYFWGLDNYPLVKTIENYTVLPPNQPPTISNLGQFKSDSIISIGESDTTTESMVVFKATLSDLDNDQVKLQVELKEFDQPFDGQNLLESEYFPSGSEIKITRDFLVERQYHWRARAIDSRGATSDWQEFGEIGNVDFEVKLVPLYTQVESDYPPRLPENEWANLEYARGFTETYFCGSRIYQCGCAITSIVMIARYYGVLEAQGKDVNPGTINEWLKSEPGGYVNGDVNWIAGAKYTDWRIKYERTDKITNNYTLLDEYLNKNQPVIAKQINPGHFIVIDNKLATTYGVKDPFWYNTKKLDEITTSWSSKIRDYNNNFYGLRIYKKGDGIAQSAITIALGSPAELLITDPQGRRLGKDANGIEYDEIPVAWYFEDGFDDPTGENPPSQERNKLIQILEPIGGEYKLEVIGVSKGSYTLQSNFYDIQGNVLSRDFQSETAPGYIAQYNISFDSTNVNNTLIELFDEIPPEAEIYFDQNSQQLIVKGIDNTTVNPTVNIIKSKKKIIYQIRDEAGNTTKLFFEKLKQKGKKIKAELKSIQYNTEPTIKFSKTRLKYKWSLAKQTNQIKKLEQRIKVKGQFDIKAKYNHQRNRTEIRIKTKETRQKQSLPGIIIIKLITKSGILGFKY